MIRSEDSRMVMKVKWEASVENRWSSLDDGTGAGRIG